MLSSKVVIFLIYCVAVPILATVDSAEEENVVLFNDGAARPGQVPFIVSIRVQTFHRASGVILNKNWVLTTASAIKGRPRNQMALYVGAHTQRDGKRLGINAIVVHPQFDARTLNNDIAMIRTVIQFNDRVRPINLPTADPHGSRLYLTTSGWGATLNPAGINIGRPYSELQIRSMRSMTLHNCRARARNLARFLHQTSICTDEIGSRRTCAGDAGSPLFNARMQLMGLLSWKGTCSGPFPAAFMNVFRYLGFIRQHMNA